MDSPERLDKSMEELFESADLTPEELSELIDMPLNAIRMAAFSGELKAKIVNHDIISINRDDALAWLANR
ncbi:MAG: hypothetical protein R2839_06180 [Thermomicrobiales bacterium]